MKKIYISLIAFLAVISLSSTLFAQDVESIGYTEGTADVTPTGAFTYNIPLDLPPGIKNVMPQISISYNSQSKGGLLGRGWDIAGLSTISRINSTIHHDANVDAVDFDNNDGFSLDGQRLVLTNTSGTTKTYVTENKNFAVITSYGVAGGGPQYWVVESKDGMIYEYGQTADSRMEASGRSDVLIWSLNKAYDRLGNYFTVKYLENNSLGNYKVDYIVYTGNAGGGVNPAVLPSTSINFYYHSRFDVNQTWVGGSLIRQSDLLERITVNHNSAAVRTYKFEYDNARLYSHLKSIQEFGENGEFLRPTKVFWGEYTQNIEPYAAFGLINTNAQTIYSCADFSGDGYTDVVALPMTTGTSSVNYEVFKNNKYDDFNSLGAVTLPAMWDSALMKITHVNNVKSMFDWNGDGREDIIIMYKSFAPVQIRVDVLLSQGGGSFGPPQTKLTYVPTWANALKYITMIPGDYDGDGKREVLLLLPFFNNEGQNLQGYNFRLLGENYDGNSPNNAGGVMSTQYSQAVAIDHDGDGRDDLLWTIPTISSQLLRLNISYNASTGDPYITPNLSLTPILAGPYPSGGDRVYMGDFNGDGNKDILTWVPTAPNKWTIGYSTGTGWNPLPINFLLTPDPEANDDDNNIYIGDFNGDGKDDILEMYLDASNPPSVSSIFRINYSKGNNQFVQEVQAFGNTFKDINRKNVNLGDFNADGQTDVLITCNSTHAEIVYFSRNDLSEYVEGIDAGIGVCYNIKTISAPQQTNYYNNSFLPYPFNRVALPIKVTKSLQRDYFKYEYEFNDFIVNRRGLGMRGFSNYTVVDATNNKKIINNFDLFSYNIPVPKSVITTTLTNAPFLTKTSFEWDEIITPVTTGAIQAVHIVYPTKTITDDFAMGTRKMIENIYTPVAGYAFPPSLGQFGKPDEVIETLGNGVEVTHKYNEYIMAASGAPFYQWGKLTKLRTVQQRSGQAPFTSTSEYTYLTNGLPQQMKIFPSTAAQRITTYGYDYFGNLISESVAGTGVTNTISNTFEYSTDGRFTTKVINALGHSESFTHNLWGSKLTHTNLHNKTTAYEYDGFNRLRKSILPNGQSKTIEYFNDYPSTDPESPGYGSGVISPLPPFHGTLAQTSYKIVEKISGILGESVKYMSPDEHIRREIKTGFGGQKLYYDYRYYNDWQLWWLKGPYNSTTSAPIKTEYKYDDYDREIERITPTSTITTSYAPKFISGVPDGMITTVTNTTTGNSKVTEIDGAGKLIRVTENSTNLYYAYHSSGNILKITSPGQTKTFIYDAFGRQIKTTTANQGTTTITYNALDQIVSTTDAAGNTYNMTYDVLGRKLTTTGSEGTYSYVYDGSSLNSKGQIISETSPYGTSKTYQYNTNSDVEIITETIDLQPFVTKYSYDTYGRIIQTEYPSGDKVLSLYNSYGNFTGYAMPTIAGGIDYVLWRKKDVNELGLLVKSEYQPSTSTPGVAVLTKDNCYDNIGFPGCLTVKNQFSTTIVDNSYNWDLATGNLSNRSDNLRNRVESFTYDNFDRLTDVAVGIPPSGPYPSPQHLSYHKSGNITANNIVSLADPYYNNLNQVAFVPNPTTAIPASTQRVVYTPFDRADSIIEGTKLIKFTYNDDDDRAMAKYYSGGSLTKTRYYASGMCYEKTIDAATGNITEIVYVGGEYGTVAMLVRKNGAREVKYVVTDYLGSVTHVFNQNGTLQEEKSFDAWGRVRDPLTWMPLSTTSYIYDRGYTGHEHLWDFGLINMNARLYDPVLGRMLQADKLITNSQNSQSYNLYSYAFNNPLRNTDVTGNSIDGIIFGAMFGMISGMQLADRMGKTGWTRIGYTLLGGVIGGSLSYASTVAVPAIANAINAGQIGTSLITVGMSASSGFITAFASAGIAGGSFGDMVSAGANGAMWAGAGSLVSEGINYAVKGLNNLSSVYEDGELKSQGHGVKGSYAIPETQEAMMSEINQDPDMSKYMLKGDRIVRIQDLANPKDILMFKPGENGAITHAYTGPLEGENIYNICHSRTVMGLTAFKGNVTFKAVFLHEMRHADFLLSGLSAAVVNSFSYLKVPIASYFSEFQSYRASGNYLNTQSPFGWGNMDLKTSKDYGNMILGLDEYGLIINFINTWHK